MYTNSTNIITKCVVLSFERYEFIMAVNHQSPDGIYRPCSNPTKCKFGTAAEDHINDKEAQQRNEQNMAEKHAGADTIASSSNEGGVTRRRPTRRTRARNTEVTEHEQKLIDDYSNNIKKILEARSEAGDLQIDEDAHDKEWAKKKFLEAVEYASSRGNEHLLSKLKKAQTLPSGSFTIKSTGKTVSTDTIIENHTRLEDLNDKSDAIRNDIKNIIKEAENKGVPVENLSMPPVAYKGANDKSRVTLSVTQELNNDEFKKLPQDIQDGALSTRTTIHIDDARANVPAGVLHKITNQTQTINYFMGKEKNIDGNTSNSNIVDGDNDTVQEKLARRQQALGEVYSSFYEANGVTQKEMKALHDENTEAAKNAASATGSQTGVYLPARSHKNGALITSNYIVDTQEAKERLDEKTFNKIAKTTTSVSTTKLRPLLKKAVKEGRITQEQADKVFTGSYKANIRVYQ